jgi:protein-histidine pros-kinase
MNLLPKLNLISLVVFAFGLGAAATVSQRFLSGIAHEHVVQNARIMMETAMAMRTYTSDHITPVLNDRSTALSGTGAAVFYPQTVPAFAATESFNYLRKQYPDYSYKEATLNPTNPRDRPSDWEADIIARFRNDNGLAEVVGQRDAASEESIYLAHPIRVAKENCLECHSTPDEAPPSMIKQYGTANGFGWKLHDVIGAQIISVPASLPNAMAARAFRALMIALVGVVVVTLLALNVSIYFSVIRPVAALTQMADAVSKGKTGIHDLPVKGSDEIALLSGAFNRMHRSLAKALKMLDE